MSKSRNTPNPRSKLLKSAVVGGAGLGLPPDSVPPSGMGVLLLYIPLEQLTNMTLPNIQADLGLPWAVEGGGTAWFDEL